MHWRPAPSRDNRRMVKQCSNQRSVHMFVNWKTQFWLNWGCSPASSGEHCHHQLLLARHGSSFVSLLPMHPLSEQRELPAIPAVQFLDDVEIECRLCFLNFGLWFQTFLMSFEFVAYWILSFGNLPMNFVQNDANWTGVEIPCSDAIGTRIVALFGAVLVGALGPLFWVAVIKKSDDWTEKYRKAGLPPVHEQWNIWGTYAFMSPPVKCSWPFGISGIGEKETSSFPWSRKRSYDILLPNAQILRKAR